MISRVLIIKTCNDRFLFLASDSTSNWLYEHLLIFQNLSTLASFSYVSSCRISVTKVSKRCLSDFSRPFSNSSRPTHSFRRRIAKFPIAKCQQHWAPFAQVLKIRTITSNGIPALAQIPTQILEFPLSDSYIKNGAQHKWMHQEEPCMKVPEYTFSRTVTRSADSGDDRRNFLTERYLAVLSLSVRRWFEVWASHVG